LFGVRVVKHEALSEKRGVVIQRRALEEQIALLVNEQPGTTGSVEDLVTETRLTLPRERIAEP
jgi:hypothetical protein